MDLKLIIILINKHEIPTKVLMFFFMVINKYDNKEIVILISNVRYQKI